MTSCYFVSDLHGDKLKYELLFREIVRNKPSFVFLGGDLLPHVKLPQPMESSTMDDFVKTYLIPGFKDVREQLGCNYPEVFVILGNDDPRIYESGFLEGDKIELWKYLNSSRFKFGPYTIYGYSFVPPTPFRLKDWEKYDVSKEINPGCIAPDKGIRTMDPDFDPESATIQHDLKQMMGEEAMEKSICLFHSPPDDSHLDTIMPGRGVSADISFKQHVGSKAIRQFIDEKQPYITLHGHIHESASLSGHWNQQFGRTRAFSAAHNGPELAIVQFEIDNPEKFERRLISE